jgi:multiple sugar transport system permease protein
MKTISIKNGLRGARQFFSQADDFFPYVLVFPLTLAITLIFLYPLLDGMLISFYEEKAFVGFKNYREMLSDKYFWHSMKLTIIYVVVYTIGVFFVGFFTAFVLNLSEKTKLKGHKVFFSFITIPYAIPDVVAALIWYWMLDSQLGIVNYFLTSLHIISSPIRWLANPDLALYTTLFVTIWRLFPLHTLIIMAGFRTIPPMIYEAAEIDGAGAFRRFFSFTIPLTANVLSLLMLLTIVWSFKRFTMLWLLTGGGPGRASETAVIQIYRYAFKFFRKNYASAIGVAVLLIVVAITLVYLVLRTRSEKEPG